MLENPRKAKDKARFKAGFQWCCAESCGKPLNIR